MYKTIDSTQKQWYYVPTTTEQRQQDAVKQHPATDRIGEWENRRSRTSVR